MSHLEESYSELSAKTIVFDINASSCLDYMFLVPIFVNEIRLNDFKSQIIKQPSKTFAYTIYIIIKDTDFVKDLSFSNVS